MITPNDIENLQFKKTPLGYSTDEVDDFLDKLVVDYEKVFKDNVKLNSRVNMLEEQLERYENLEETIKTSVMLAEKTAKDAKANAEEQADNILDRAEIKAEKIVSGAIEHKAELEQEIHALKKTYQLIKAKIRMMLEAEMKLLDDESDIFDWDETAEDVSDDIDDADDDIDNEKNEPLTVPNEKSDKKAEQAQKLKVLADLFEEE